MANEQQQQKKTIVSIVWHLTMVLLTCKHFVMLYHLTKFLLPFVERIHALRQRTLTLPTTLVSRVWMDCMLIFQRQRTLVLWFLIKIFTQSLDKDLPLYTSAFWRNVLLLFLFYF